MSVNHCGAQGVSAPFPSNTDGAPPSPFVAVGCLRRLVSSSFGAFAFWCSRSSVFSLFGPMLSSDTLIRGTLDLLVLKALIWGPRHGYAVAEWVNAVTRGELLVEEG